MACHVFMLVSTYILCSLLLTDTQCYRAVESGGAALPHQANVGLLSLAFTYLNSNKHELGFSRQGTFWTDIL